MQLLTGCMGVAPLLAAGRVLVALDVLQFFSEHIEFTHHVNILRRLE